MHAILAQVRCSKLDGTGAEKTSTTPSYSYGPKITVDPEAGQTNLATTWARKRKLDNANMNLLLFFSVAV